MNDKNLKIAESGEVLLGFDIGGTKCAVIIGSSDGGKPLVLAREAFATEPGPEATLSRLRSLARRLLARRTEANVLLSTPENVGEPNRAWRLYRRLGFADIIRSYHFAGDPRPFAILGRTLPL